MRRRDSVIGWGIGSLMVDFVRSSYVEEPEERDVNDLEGDMIRGPIFVGIAPQVKYFVLTLFLTTM